MKKFEKNKNSIKDKIKKIKNYIKENTYIIISWSQFILTIVMAILLICSLVTTSTLLKQIDDISKQNTIILNNINSQESTESDINTSSETETDDITSTTDNSSSEESIDISSNVSSATVSSSTESTSSTVSMGTTTDLDLLACVIYQEAGGNGSCDTCRRRVADVVLNRVADSRFPNTIRDVLTAENQYGAYHYTGVVWPKRAKNVNEQDAVARAYRIAEEVLNGQHSDLYGKGYIWQAAFKQGTDRIKCCGTYFGK